MLLYNIWRFCSVEPWETSWYGRAQVLSPFQNLFLSALLLCTLLLVTLKCPLVQTLAVAPYLQQEGCKCFFSTKMGDLGKARCPASPDHEWLSLPQWVTVTLQPVATEESRAPRLPQRLGPWG